MSRLEPVNLPLRTPLYAVGESPRHVTFVTAGIASVVTEMSTGEAVEVGLVGCEGLGESLQLMGPAKAQTRCFMQAEGTGLRMSFRAFQQEFLPDAEVRRRVMEHVQFEALTTGQLAACNRLHETEERLARWLMMVSSRLVGDEIELTQEFLAEMLGTRRSTVTISAGALQRSGFIEYRRGKIRILDRDKLADAACECYMVIHNMYQKLYQP